MGALCFSCSQRSPGPQHPWKGSNTPSSCRNGKRPGFYVAQCLFCFYFCFVTRESLGNSGSRPAPSAAGRPQGPRGPRLPHPIPAFPTNARRGPRFRGQRELLLLPGAEGDSAGWIQPKRFFCFPLRVSRVQLPAIDDSCRHSPLPPASFLGDKSTKDWLQGAATRSWQHAVRKLSIPINYIANLTRPANAKQSARSFSSEQEGSAKSHGPRLFAPNPGRWRLIPDWGHYLIAQELQLQDLTAPHQPNEAELHLQARFETPSGRQEL